MKNLIIFTTIFVIFLLTLLPAGLTFAIKIIPGGVQPSLRNTEKIYGDFILQQSFISPQNNLAGIGVSIKNPNFANKKDATFNILDESNNIIRKVTLNGQNIADGNFIKILFDPIPDAKDKKFTWTISSPQSTFDDALEIFLTDKQPPWSTDFKVSGKTVPDGLSYVTLHRPASSTEVLRTVFNGWVDKFTQDQFFMVGYLLIIILLSGGIIFSKSGSHYLKKQN